MLLSIVTDLVIFSFYNYNLARLRTQSNLTDKMRLSYSYDQSLREAVAGLVMFAEIFKICVICTFLPETSSNSNLVVSKKLLANA